MRKMLATAFVVAITLAVFSASAFAASHKFKLSKESTIAGIHLEKGKYKLALDGNQATIYQNGKVVATARVTIREEKVARSSVLRASDGSIKEIRMRKRNQVVVFAQ